MSLLECPYVTRGGKRLFDYAYIIYIFIKYEYKAVLLN